MRTSPQRWLVLAALLICTAKAQPVPPSPAAEKLDINPPVRIVSEQDAIKLPKDLAGSATLRVVIDVHGVPTEIRVTESGGKEIDKYALQAVGKWRYQPATRDGVPIQTAMTLTYVVGEETAELDRPRLIREPPESPPPVVVEPAALDSLPAGVYRIGGDVSAPVVKYRMDAQYTDLARAQRVTGSVVLRAIVRVHGGLTDIKVVQGLGAGLDEKAVQAAKLWRFVPGEKGGEPVPVEITLEFPFQP